MENEFKKDELDDEKIQQVAGGGPDAPDAPDACYYFKCENPSCSMYRRAVQVKVSYMKNGKAPCEKCGKSMKMTFDTVH